MQEAQPSEAMEAPKVWRGRFFEDFTVGDIFRSRLGRTVTESDNLWFTCLTHNTNQIHFNSHYAAATRFERPLVNSTFTLALITGLSVADTSENAIANLGWADVRLPHPVFAGDTLWAESEVRDTRLSRSRPHVGIVGIRTRGLNQHGQEVITFERSFMIPTRAAARDHFPTAREAAEGTAASTPRSS